MGHKVLTTCDVGQSPECKESIPTEEPPSSWATWSQSGGEDRHICGPCADYSRKLLFSDRKVSEGEYLKVKHEIIPEHPDLESANVHAGTHGMYVMPVIDEPPPTFPKYDPPLGPETEPEAWAFHVSDHLHVYIIGSHKDEPRVIVDSDEFPTKLETRDREDSFIMLGDRGGSNE